MAAPAPVVEPAPPVSEEQGKEARPMSPQAHLPSRSGRGTQSPGTPCPGVTFFQRGSAFEQAVEGLPTWNRRAYLITA